MYVLRFPRDALALARLRVEERVTAGLRGRVSLRIPDTRVVELGADLPSFALHEMIPGRDWFDLGLKALPAAAGSLLALDLAWLICQTHSVPLETAGEWLGLETREPGWRGHLAARDGKPSWFAGEMLEEIRRRLASTIPQDLAPVFEDVADHYDRLTVSVDDLAFGHGDLHGGNLAFAEDGVSPRLVGVFDFENAGIFDCHYDFARLNLIYDELQDRVLDEYARLVPDRPLDRARVETYTRAFLFYLLAEQVDEGRFEHMVRLLRTHVRHYDSRARAAS